MPTSRRLRRRLPACRGRTCPCPDGACPVGGADHCRPRGRADGVRASHHAAGRDPAAGRCACPAAARRPAPVDPVLAEVRRQLAEPAKGNVDRADRAALAAFYAARSEPLLWVARRRLHAPGPATPWPRSPRPTTGASRPSRLRAAAAGAGRDRARCARRRRDQARPRRPQVCAPCPRRPPRPRADQQAHRREAHPARPQGGARGGGRDRDARQLSARPASQARAVPAPAPGAAEGARRRTRRPSRQAADPAAVRLPDGPQPQARHASIPHVALLRQRLGLPLPRGAENVFDLEVQEAVKAFQQQNGIQPTGILTPRTRAALNGGVRSTRRPGPRSPARRRSA